MRRHRNDLGLRQIQNNLFRVLVVSLSQKRCLPQLLILSPFGESDFAHKLWRDPLDFFGMLGGFSTGGFSVKNGLNRSIASGNPFSLNPVPE
jgi:hypothetical protein